MDDVFGIGNPLVDILVDVEESLLEELGLNKGQFHLVDKAKIDKLLERIDNLEIMLSPGDSTANTLVGIANLGGKTIFCGKIGDDKHGEYYNLELTKGNVKSSVPTGKAICLITPDKERTFVVYLGASLTLSKGDVLEEDVKNCKIIHLTGYQLEDIELRKTSTHLIELARKNGKLISVDLADPGLVERNLSDLKDILKDVDIIFANEEEAKAFTGKEREEAVKILEEYCNIVIVKIGAEGSFISKEGKIIFIEGVKANLVDTTGAGDMYAAGILFGITHDLDVESAGKLASYSAAKVVEQKGARLNDENKKKVLEYLRRIKDGRL